jgi:dihydrofolate reductase/thymidylate synthase
MLFFKNITSNVKVASKQNAVIMGRRTWESIPKKFRPLAGRLNVVLSRNANARSDMELSDAVLVSDSLEHALVTLSEGSYADSVEQVFVIGGGSVYAEGLASKLCKKVYLTEVYISVPDIDTFFPSISAQKYRLVSRSHLSADVKKPDITYRFTEYDAIDDDSIVSSSTSRLGDAGTVNMEEQQYLDIVKDILENGVLRGDRTGTGTLSKFGVQMRFSLRNNVFPLLTTKKVFWRGVAEELIWFVGGRTNAKVLNCKRVISLVLSLRFAIVAQSIRNRRAIDLESF